MENQQHPTEIVDKTHFWNTTSLAGNELVKADEKCEKQELIVFRFFQKNAETEFTPCEVWQQLIADKKITATVPITSIRRAICNLTRNLCLVRTMNKKLGIYNAMNFTWKLAKFEQAKLF